MSQPYSEVWVLIDCNNFFVSCERVFRPDLKDKPVLVLSSNDGCTVSRSSEVKALGIAMGAPKFQIEKEIKRYGIDCFSSNFALYGDISSRVMKLIADEVGGENQEIYSIDECFIRGDELGVKDWWQWGKNLRAKISRGAGIPVTIGIAPTKTLAKLAGEVAKKDVLGEGVMYWSNQDLGWRERYLSEIPVSEVWGIGRRFARKLFGLGIETVAQLSKKEAQWVRKEMGLGGERTWRELEGESCIGEVETRAEARQILRSRSFGEGVESKAELRRAVAEYMTIAAENLRRNRLRASLVSVFIRTSYFGEKKKKYGAMKAVSLDQSSSYLPDLMKAAEQALEGVFREGYVYKKAGVILSGLENEESWQPALVRTSVIEEERDVDEQQKQLVMKTIDRLNGYYGQRKVNVGIVSYSQKDKGKRVMEKWQSKATLKSQEYTTSWDELRLVN